ncbi:MAG: D-alanyl-D-alanine carboxypeptidase [Xylanivirga thermophila]|jgi:serine-type D-Ala-D-Ala carboxypeptidase (penicillin-binding protein 5/6)|uniref:D-alanyl-D-alanine carboxypeptidase family protein n=1 Tax=Xylanivirga thermophila TaxID=2496273 RepID=UPI00101D6C02|nr:D-alanyl-D-alanine carboxypeptidase family protein [Xylanivirga thermophila]
MKKIIRILAVLVCISILGGEMCFAAPPEIAAKGAVLMEVESGRILYEKNARKKMPMASTTKIMTAILAIENGSMDDIVTVSDKAYGVEGSSIYLDRGEKICLENLLYGLMLRSGNDAAVAIAEHIGGSLENFVDMMNKKAIELGAKDTHFVNPHGLHDDLHYTTAYDLALISTYAMKNPIFRTIVSTKYKKIPWENHEWDRVLQNKNKILWDYEGGNGIKTGYTKKSRRCLVSSALRSNMQLVCVVLDCQPWFEDSMAIMDYCFDTFKPYTVFSSEQLLKQIHVEDGFEKEVGAVIKDDIILPVKEGEEENIKIKFDLPDAIKAPVKAGDQIGNVAVSLADEVSIIRPLYADSDVMENTFISNIKRIFMKWITNGL